MNATQRNPWTSVRTLLPVPQEGARFPGVQTRAIFRDFGNPNKPVILHPAITLLGANGEGGWARIPGYVDSTTADRPTRPATLASLVPNPLALLGLGFPVRPSALVPGLPLDRHSAVVAPDALGWTDSLRRDLSLMLGEGGYASRVYASEGEAISGLMESGAFDDAGADGKDPYDPPTIGAPISDYAETAEKDYDLSSGL